MYSKTIMEVLLNQKRRVNACEQTCHLYSVFTYIYSLLIEKDLCECRNISVNFWPFFQRSFHFFCC